MPSGQHTQTKFVVGVKQSGRALAENRAETVSLASDADPAVTEPIEQLCRAKKVRCDKACTMRELGLRAGIDVGATVITYLK